MILGGVYPDGVVHTMSAHVCGLDVHKRYTYATVLGPTRAT